MRPLYLLLLSLFLSSLAPLFAQDTLSFGGIYDLPGAEVRASYTPVSPLAQRFTIEEVYRLPGTFYDPARLVALLPGVVQTNDQANHLSVRGNTPNANLWRLNGLAIVNPNHTANAGTFYDFPTLSGGGVNAISAQMLGNSGFLAGGLPVEYGFATGGTFDLRLRPGSKTRRKYQAQAGFIGFDLMAEGPIGKSGKTSYLVNGRYSFTSLLADMGVDFGGEEIRFADVNAHLHHEWDGGELSAFAIVGQSSNVFRGPDSTEQEITEQKELFDIDFESGVGIGGISFKHDFIASGISGGFALSSVASERGQQLNEDGEVIGTQEIDLSQISANLVYSRLLSKKSRIKVGAEFFRQNLDASLLFPSGNNPLNISGNPVLTASAPFIGYELFLARYKVEFGARGSYFDGPRLGEWVIEPRIKLTRKGRRSTLTLSGEQTGQPMIQELLTASRSNGRTDLFVPVSWQVSLRYGRKIKSINYALTLFRQKRLEEYETSNGVSMNNFLEIDPRARFTEMTTSSRYGAELEFSGGDKNKGWYYRGSGAWLKSFSEKNTGSRFSTGFSGKLMVGREWNGGDKADRPRNYGLNLALIFIERNLYQASFSSLENSSLFYFSPPQPGLYISTGPYFRPDLRLYKTKTRPKTTTTLALDVQNVANVQNTANVYYDAFLERPNERFQLGLIPVLSYRIVWR